MDTRIDIVSAVKRVLDAKNGVFLRRMKQPIEAVSLCEEHADLTAFSLADKIKVRYEDTIGPKFHPWEARSGWGTHVMTGVAFTTGFSKTKTLPLIMGTRSPLTTRNTAAIGVDEKITSVVEKRQVKEKV
ncbi:hypothetical protein C8J57DRAFT_1245771 [Mycena rebaudengoi]|nr:hypothetical protein C8J57DRAFT_1245771 [Mycena rebaudengoi]